MRHARHFIAAVAHRYLRDGRAAATVATLASPDGALEVSVTLDADGRPGYAVSRRGRPVIAESRLGFILADAPKLERNFRARGVRDAQHRRNLGAALGRAALRAQPLQRAARARSSRRRRWRAGSTVVFRVSTTASVSATNSRSSRSSTQVEIVEELTEFAVAEPATAWWIPAGEWNRYEYLYQQDAARRSRPGAHADDAAHRERPAHRHPRGGAGRLLRHVAATRARAAAEGGAVAVVERARACSAQAPFATPWRTMQIATDAAGPVHVGPDPQSQRAEQARRRVLGQAVQVRRHLVGHAPRHRRPGASGPKHGATTAEREALHRLRRAATAFAACWSKAGTRAGTATGSPNGERFQLHRSLSGLRHRGARRLREEEGRAPRSATTRPPATSRDYEKQLGAALDLYAEARHRRGEDRLRRRCRRRRRRWDADGTIHFEWHDGQVHVAPSPARGRRGGEAPHRGESRTSRSRTRACGARIRTGSSREGARGMEYNAWGNPPNPPEHEANLVFTRMLPGPMDFTPGVLSLTGARRQAHPVHDREAAGAVRRALQPDPDGGGPAGELREVSRSRSSSSRTCRRTGATRACSTARSATTSTIARKDRNSDDWYLGAITDENARADPGRPRFPGCGRRTPRRFIVTATMRTGTRIPTRS